MIKNAMDHEMAMDAVNFAHQVLRPHKDYFSALVRAEQSLHSHVQMISPTQITLAKAALAFMASTELVKVEQEKRL